MIRLAKPNHFLVNFFKKKNANDTNDEPGREHFKWVGEQWKM